MQQKIIWGISLILIVGYLYLFYDELKDRPKDNRQKKNPLLLEIITFLFAPLIPIILILITTISFKVNVLNVVIFVFLGFYLIMFTLFKYKKIFPELVKIILFLLFIIIPVTLLIIKLQKNSYQFLNRIEKSVEVQTNDLDLSSIEASFEKIRKKYQEIENTVSFETKNMSKIIEEMKLKLKEKNQDLKKMNERELELKKELEYYKAINSLNEEQASAVIKSLRQRKYLDYLIGGLIGFVMSFSVAFISNKDFRNQIINRKKADYDG